MYKNIKKHLTARVRFRPSAPLQRLKFKNMIKGKTLDFGCGRGFDAKYLECDKYDPHYQPVWPQDTYDTILCTYVLNVLEPNEEGYILNDIRELLNEDGVAYITVRRDVKNEGYNFRGTYQRNVILEEEIFYEGSSYCTYIIRR